MSRRRRESVRAVRRGGRGAGGVGGREGIRRGSGALGIVRNMCATTLFV